MLTSLPVFLTPLIGRQRELATLEQLLLHANVRLVTITGPGGVGKTRLAVAAASRLADEYPVGMAFISLVSVSKPEGVLGAVAEALGIQEGDDASRTALERVAAYIHAKTFLLILDNFEHVVEAASQIPDLLAACPNLKILATSRQLLRVRAEQEFAVPLLSMPDLERLVLNADLASVLPRYSAVQLFLERMRAIRVDYEPDEAALRAIAALCVRLDGLPLAIELAAARTRIFTPEQLLAQLGAEQADSSLKLLTGGARDLPARQRTLGRTIQWSYDLLSEQEQRVFRGTSIFADTFSLSEAQKLLERTAESAELAHTDLIASLVEKNLLRQDASQAEPRLRMLVMLQEFGRAEAGRLGETAALHAAHAATFLELAEESLPKLYTRAQIEMTARLRRDVNNLRWALRWALEQDDLDPAARFGIALSRFWILAGLLGEGQGWLKEILARLGYDPDGAAGKARQPDLEGMPASEIGRLAELLYGLGVLGYRRTGSGRPEVIHWLSQSRDLYLRVGARTRAALATTALARANLFLSLYQEQDETQRYLDESYAVLQAAGHVTGLADNLYAQARAYFYTNEPDKANRAMQHCLDLLRETGNVYELAHATKFAGDLAFGRAGGYQEVRRHHANAAEMFAALGNLSEATLARAIVSVISGWVDGDWQAALVSVEEARRVTREHGAERAAALCMAIASWVYAHLGRYEEAKGVAVEAIRAAFALSHQTAFGGAFIGLAMAERMGGDYVAAVAAISAVASYRTHNKSLAYTRGNSLYLAGLNHLQRELDPADFTRAWSTGPARLVELLPGPDVEAIDWPLASIPELDLSLISRREQGRQSPEPEEPAATTPGIPEPLTAREKDVLKYLVEGLTDPQIAEALVISPRTVHAHLRNIYSKLGVNSRTAATRLALEHSLV